MKFSIESDNSSFVWLHRTLDFCLPILLLLSITHAYNVPWHDRYTILGVLGGAIFTTFAQMVGIYQNWRGRAISTSINLIIKAWFLTWVILISIAFLFKDAENFSRLITTLWGGIVPIALILYRITIRLVLSKLSKKGKINRKIVIIGAGHVGQHIAEVINKNPWLGYQIMGFYDDNPQIKTRQIKNYSILGTTEKAIEDARQHQYDEVYICLPLKAESKIKQLLDEFTDSTVIVKFVPDLFSLDLLNAKWDELNGIPIISVNDTPLSSNTAKFIKRTEDIILSTIILILISPIMLIISIGVKLSSPGPIIFKQTRYGVNGEKIQVYKFRSMTTLENGSEIIQATKNDKRVTSFGKFLRRTSLDELPQFINVIQGKMSIVGPRPHACAHNEQYRKLIPKYMQRHIVKPGITGWAQINGWRGETDTLKKMEKRVEYDLHYVNNWTLWLDLKIIFLTIFKGFTDKNAY